MDDGEDCTTVRMCLVPLYYTHKYGYMCFLLCDFNHIKKKEETNGGPWEVLWGSYASWARPEEWEGVGRVNRGQRKGRCVQRPSCREEQDWRRRSPAWLLCFLLEPLPWKDLWWVPIHHTSRWASKGLIQTRPRSSRPFSHSSWVLRRKHICQETKANSFDVWFCTIREDIMKSIPVYMTPNGSI